MWPSSLGHTIERLLAKRHHDQRYASATVARTALEHALASDDVLPATLQTSKPIIASRSRGVTKRHLPLLAGVGVAIVARRRRCTRGRRRRTCGAICTCDGRRTAADAADSNADATTTADSGANADPSCAVTRGGLGAGRCDQAEHAAAEIVDASVATQINDQAGGRAASTILMRASLAIVIVVATAACFDMPPRPQATGSGAVDAPIGGGGDAALHDAGAFSSDAAFGHVNIAFVTSKGFVPGGLSGPDGGDTACMAFAVAAGFPGPYVAWLAASTRNATTKLGTSRGWVRPDGLPVVDTIADLTAGKIMYPIAIDDAGSDHTADTNTVVVTGASANGSATTSTCTNFTTTTGQVTCGVPNATTTVWTTQIVTSCANANRLYCFGVGIEQEVDPPPAPPDAHIAFISANGFQVTGGLPAADSLCQTEATAATLPGSYIALLAIRDREREHRA